MNEKRRIKEEILQEKKKKEDEEDMRIKRELKELETKYKKELIFESDSLEYDNYYNELYTKNQDKDNELLNFPNIPKKNIEKSESNIAKNAARFIKKNEYESINKKNNHYDSSNLNGKQKLKEKITEVSEFIKNLKAQAESEKYQNNKILRAPGRITLGLVNQVPYNSLKLDKPDYNLSYIGKSIISNPSSMGKFYSELSYTNNSYHSF